ncbi:hypothetical protein GMES_1228 [Paraglaciecola mesophila KMM 241]|uniref:Carrier domain-containing protein n=1 Tax=Paraglaciecola mesophila KMM 241 TaxID=1128912 RepID=K6YZD4_9ALTE|nr:hypothetical protein [Paraglaciecola mesophila]GAC23527.1 hypothetical protein GMES_1228 [Paraglaciecola mesophila KMM 241]
MTHDEIQSLVFAALELTNQSREDDAQVPISPETALFGKQGHLDSMGLVALLIDIEDMLLDQDIQVSLSDERAMSAANSPFKNVSSLVEHIDKLLSGE